MKSAMGGRSEAPTLLSGLKKKSKIKILIDRRKCPKIYIFLIYIQNKTICSLSKS